MAYRKVKVTRTDTGESLTLPFTNDRAADRFAFIAREKGFDAEVDFHKYSTFHTTDKALESLKSWSS